MKPRFQNPKPRWSLSLLASVVLMSSGVTSHSSEFHVALDGNDAQRGTKDAPFRTIQHAADLAQPGDVITVHAGVYRERVNPPRGGTSDRKRIVYQAARGEEVAIKGSEIVKGWAKVQPDVWKVTLPNTFFGSFNPFSDLIRGDWFDRKGRDHHTGAVYLNGHWLTEAPKLEEVMAPVDDCPRWFAHVGEASTTITAQFKGVDPNTECVEINVRRTVFYPEQSGRNYLTVRGFTLQHAATPWAPPTAEQIGLIGTHWSRGWIIEDNVVSHSVCSGIALGKHGDAYDNTSANTAEGYVKTIERAHAHPIAWTRENLGHHVVRRNAISHCEQAGIVGSLGAAFSTVTDNVIHDIHVRRLFGGAEMAGIKFHAAIDTTIARNHIYRTCLGLWLDWMAQGARVSRNLFHDNAGQDLFVEVDHGPFVVDNNLFLSGTSLLDMSEGGAYAHNLFAGRIVSRPEPNRETPYHPAHSTTVAGLATIKGGDNRFYNNVLVGTGENSSDQAQPAKDPEWRGGYGLWVYDFREFPVQTGGNLHYHGARPYRQEMNGVVAPTTNPNLKLVQENGQFALQLALGAEVGMAATEQVTTALLGHAKIPKLAYEDADGSGLKIDRDFFGRKRSKAGPTPGPFERPGTGSLVLQLR
jgi:alpha-N-arabinofuranosidase